ncbi:MAG: hypothetical protein QOI38_2947 [Sphingomonadales bacterium]|jgi:hypothetical protein|nr:hypothetical protein [Sphingomonadales bacterium]
MTRRNADDPDPPGGRASKRLEQFRESRRLPDDPPLPGHGGDSEPSGGNKGD